MARETERLGDLEIVGSTPRGALVVGDDGRRFSALVRSRQAAEQALRGPLAILPRHEHRESLVDVGVVPGGLVLLMEPPVITTLGRILASHEPLSAGVVVTVLGPVIEAVRAAAGSGVDLVVGADTIGLTSDGAPVVLVADLTDSKETPAEALRSLLARCAGACVDRLVVPEHGSELEALEAFLYRVAPPRPLGSLLLAEPATAESLVSGPVPRRPWAPGTVLRRARSAAAVVHRRRAAPAEAASSTPESPGRHRRSHPLDGWQERLLGVARTHRGPLAAGVAIVLGAAVASAVSAGPATDRASPVPVTASSAVPSPIATPPDAGTSPESAAEELVSAASACIGAGAPCLAALTTGDSPLRADDETEEALIPDGSEIRAVLADENGGSALVSLESSAGTTAASVLIIRTEAGWLIRDVFSGDPP
ncbi:hypothetical protein [Rathayibacter sp. VKM Ac-2754]|uniref:hypothetical protein n=1 Tax=Rathayibacter sp. VKM Ac-2754 TaxID=2609251 RepID=UPI0013567CCD|nr:hypothetical protein [Rathayibacter sp. VKM Ac-2754]MWV58100.1 hypothetical protein [Rathayibacter sp. VKM Ac-2754]